MRYTMRWKVQKICKYKKPTGEVITENYPPTYETTYDGYQEAEVTPYGQLANLQPGAFMGSSGQYGTITPDGDFIPLGDLTPYDQTDSTTNGSGTSTTPDDEDIEFGSERTPTTIPRVVMNGYDESQAAVSVVEDLSSKKDKPLAMTLDLHYQDIAEIFNAVSSSEARSSLAEGSTEGWFYIEKIDNKLLASILANVPGINFAYVVYLSTVPNGTIITVSTDEGEINFHQTVTTTTTK